MLLMLCKKDRPVWVLCSMLSKPKPGCFRGFVGRGRAEQKVLLLSLMRRRWLKEGCREKGRSKTAKSSNTHFSMHPSVVISMNSYLPSLHLLHPAHAVDE